MFDLQIIKDRISELQNYIEKQRIELKNAPHGRIKLNRKGSRDYFDFIDGARRRRLSVRNDQDQALARAIAQRDYDMTVMKRAEEELGLLKKLEEVYQGGCAEDIYQKINEPRRGLIVPVELTDKQFAEKWQAQMLQKAEIPKEVTTFKTERGEKVRSKSEVFIADTLRRNDRKYHYECAVKVINHLTGEPRILYPDFYVLNPRTRKAYYWEHFGKCDDADYVNRNLNKLIDYQSAGIVLGRNLIMTFETKTIPFTPEMADEVIREYLM